MTNSLPDPLRQSLTRGSHTFPGFWSYMMPPEFLQLDFPDERQSTCMSCPKICSDSFRPDYRCCTYHPRIPNFALGLALETKSGQAAVAKAHKKAMLTPEGMASSPDQYLDYLRDLKDDQFGKSNRVQCPMLEPKTGYCQVHSFRNSVCSTFFCMKDHDQKGEKFWSQVQLLGSQIEIALSQWCLIEAGFDFDGYLQALASWSLKLKSMSAPQASGKHSPQAGGFCNQALDDMWGAYRGRERALFKACAAFISDYRDVLWDIAQGFTIREASAFDRQMIQIVPSDLTDQIDESDLSEETEPVSCQELWSQVKRSYAPLWQLPQGFVELNSKAVIFDQSNHHGNAPGYTLTLKNRSNQEETSLTLTAAQKELVELFRTPRSLDWQLLSSDQARAIPQPKRFISELWAQKIFVKSRRSEPEQ